MNPLNLSPAEFQNFLTEERQYRSPEQIDDLIRRYNAANSLSGKLAGLLEPQEGRRRTNILPASVPVGMSLMEALQSGEAEFAIPQGIVDMVTGTVRGVENPALAAQGRIPASDMNAAGFETAAAAMGLGGLLATKPAGSVGSNALFTRKPDNIMDEFNPETYYHGTRADIDAFDENMVDLGVHVGTKGQANERLQDLIRKENGVYASPFDSFSNIEGQKPESIFRTGQGPAENAQILPLKVRANYPLRMPDVGEWDRSEVVMYYIEKMLGEDGDPKLREAFEDFDFDGLDDVRDQFYDNDDWKASVENREFLDDIRDRIKDAGYDSIVYRNAVESSRDEGIQDSMIVLDPRNLRSVNAEFDPYFEYSSNLLAANTSKSGGLLSAAAQAGEKYFADDTVDIFKRQAQNPASRETITYMSPQEFLNLAQKTTAGEKTENTRKVLSEGKQFSDIPFLSIENKGDGVAQVVGHEGRNRMMALAEAGVESVPVRLNMQGGDGPAIRWGSAIDPDSRDYIDPTDIPVRLINEDQNMVYDMPDSSVYPITQNAPVRAGLLDVGPYKKPVEPSKLTEEQQEIQRELDDYILLNEILSDYDLSANASKGTGALTIAADVSARGDQVLNLLKSGRGSEVTDAMLDMGDGVKNTQLNQYLAANYDLPMDEASRLARAQELGYESDLFHGTDADILALDKEKFGLGENLLGKGFYTTGNPKRANIYVPIGNPKLPKGVFQTGNSDFTEGGNILPLMTRSSSEFDARQSTGKANAFNIGKAFEGSDFDVEIKDEGDQVFIKSKTNPDLSVYIDSYQDGMITLQKLKDVFGRENVTNILEEAGFTGLKAPESSGSVTRVNYNPQDVRSQFARFDPRLSHLSNVTATNASPLVGLLTQGLSEKQANKIEDYLYRTGLLQ